MIFYAKQTRCGLVVAVNDLLDWAASFASENRIVKQETRGGYFISTVFLGLNFGVVQDFFYETMVFDPDGEEVYCRRYSTRQQANHGHLMTVIDRPWNEEEQWPLNVCPR